MGVTSDGISPFHPALTSCNQGQKSLFSSFINGQEGRDSSFTSSSFTLSFSGVSENFKCFECSSSPPPILLFFRNPHFLHCGRMAEVRGDNPEEGVREVEEAQMPHELNPLYNWATRDVLGSPSTLTEDYLKSLKESGVICGGGEEEEHYRVELPRRGERICELNLEHPRVPHWLWVNEVMFTEFGVRIPFTSFQQRLLQRCFVAPSQFHPNAWSSIRCFELVTEYLELPQDPEVFLYLFIVFSPNVEGKTKKGYMSVRPGKYRRIFGLYEESFHDFKG
ncbi:hypothetical protein PIB30_015843 [Stylosanthes scabra]|uniref:Uncharacterized protein n=1 Tax=Stylosanthes scabra TaxID=79078 RepID=A0ABU6R7F8_9FABA|nr:hypothetical protein [Stylosanthes scabra]